MKKIILLFMVLALFTSASFAAKYEEYEGTLKNEVLEVKTINQNQISIETKKLEPKGHVASYAYGYEYLIRNNTGRDIILNRVISDDRISHGGAWGRSQIPHGSDMVPVYGLVKNIKTDVEQNRFTKDLPENEIIRAGGTLRVLMLGPKKVNHVATFYFNVNNQNVPITVR